MKKIYKEKQLLELNNYLLEVIESIRATINVLNENYGINRDLGGYVLMHKISLISKC